MIKHILILVSEHNNDVGIIIIFFLHPFSQFRTVKKLHKLMASFVSAFDLM